MPTDKFLRGNDFVTANDVLDLEQFVKGQNGASGDLTDLVTKTQNISLSGTDNTKTTFLNQFLIAGLLDCDGQVNFTGDVSLNQTPIVTQTSFTNDQQLVTKKYVDDNTGSSGNKELYNFTGLNEATYLSPLTGNSSGIENVLYNGEYVTIKSAITTSAGRVMSFDANTNNANEYAIDFCNGGTGEQNASSQVLGILLDDVVAGEYCRVATKGICSVLVGSTTTAQRGAMVTLGGSASSYQGRVVCTSRTSNEPSVGICMSYGSKSANDPIVVFLQTTFESY
jgi:hypothetical protein